MELSCKTRLIFVMVMGMFSFQSYAFDSLRVEQDGGQYFVIHKVEKGETLYSLKRRYGADLKEITKVNNIQSNQISLSQELKIPIKRPENLGIEKKQDRTVNEEYRYHRVSPGETLYAISRKYGVSVAEIKDWNNLTSNELAIDQQIVIGHSKVNQTNASASEEKPVEKEITQPKEDIKKIPTGFTEYYVQSGELIESIAAKFKVRPDSVVIWNDLPNTYLSIGQKLLIRGKIDQETLNTPEDVEILDYGKRRKVKDQSGFIKIFEEGTAKKIEDIDTKKYLVLHRSLPIGTLVEIRNLMNNKKIYARVVGKLPETGLNDNILIRLTPICFERLGVIDPKTRVEVSFYQD